jgi:GntR family transcriptional regulator, rspAB operon transcriptional repressor
MQPKPRAERHSAADAPVSLRELAYLEIKRRINRLEYRPGAYLNEAQISRHLKIGRTPVHQALDRLMLEGLVQVIPRKGVVVQPITLDQALHILEARSVNEPYCAGLAAERATAADLARMQEMLSSAGPLIRGRDREKLMYLDRAFHRLISDAAHNSVMGDILTVLHERSLRFWFVAFSDDLQLRRIDDEHRAILAALKRRDRAGAEAAMRAHVDSSRNHIMRAI